MLDINREEALFDQITRVGMCWQSVGTELGKCWHVLAECSDSVGMCWQSVRKVLACVGRVQGTCWEVLACAG